MSPSTFFRKVKSFVDDVLVYYGFRSRFVIVDEPELALRDRGALLKRRNELQTQWMRWQATELDHLNCSIDFRPLTRQDIRNIFLEGYWINWDDIEWKWPSYEVSMYWSAALRRDAQRIYDRAIEIMMDRTLFGFDVVRINPDGSRERVDPRSISPTTTKTPRREPKS